MPRISAVLMRWMSHHEIGDRAAEEAMRHRHRRHRRKGNGVERHDMRLAVLAQDIALIAAGVT